MITKKHVEEGLATQEEKSATEKLKRVRKMTDTLQAMLQEGVEEYERTHSICCDAELVNDMCLSCKEHSGNQWENK